MDQSVTLQRIKKVANLQQVQKKKAGYGVPVGGKKEGRTTQQAGYEARVL